ncbi:hypothetical protein [Persicitalea jodogahamensis]|uniref:Uncharacterized protein n=1 Tax=Persicitalea jodogahamensis TaxID=402147 RepID=A0A8J3D2Y9_9BACT|nr:hypothetical protein [Persicitalea jodogahamensis]GHB64099.1 hypothetical protein GCM10007390_17470 [Persicitalea jodogahamensis]
MSPSIPSENTVTIKGIEIVDFLLSQPKIQFPPNTPFLFDISIEHQAFKEEKLISVLTTIGVLTDESKIHLGKLTTICTYSVTGIDDFFEGVIKEYSLKEEIALYLNSTSYSTTRGIMYSQFRGTFLHNAVLPIIANEIFLTRN